MSLAQLLAHRRRRRFSLWRVVGPATWLRIVLYSLLATLAVGWYRSPGLAGTLQAADSVGAFATAVLGAVPLLFVAVIFVGMTLFVLVTGFVREVRRSLGRGPRYGRNRGSGGYADYDAVGAGGLLGGGLLGGVFDSFDSLDGDDGDDE